MLQNICSLYMYKEPSAEYMFAEQFRHTVTLLRKTVVVLQSFCEVQTPGLFIKIVYPLLKYFFRFEIGTWVIFPLIIGIATLLLSIAIPPNFPSLPITRLDELKVVVLNPQDEIKSQYLKGTSLLPYNTKLINASLGKAFVAEFSQAFASFAMRY